MWQRQHLCEVSVGSQATEGIISTAAAAGLWCGWIFEELTPFSFSQCLEPCKESWDLKENQCQDLCEVCYYKKKKKILGLPQIWVFMRFKLVHGGICWGERWKGEWSTSFLHCETESEPFNVLGNSVSHKPKSKQDGHCWLKEQSVCSKSLKSNLAYIFPLLFFFFFFSM